MERRFAEIFGRIFCDACGPVPVIALLFKLLDEAEEAVLDLVMESVKFLKACICDLASASKTNCSSHGFRH